MCGRVDIKRSLSPIVSEFFGINFDTPDNDNLCPTQNVSTIIKPPSGFQQLNTNWGIKPSWSKKLLINAQGETVAAKKTFQESFAIRRCVVPCSGWYEWRAEGDKKVKYRFVHKDGEPLYMGGIWYDHENTELVTLTTQPNDKCAKYHKRMPVLILPDNIDYWFESPVEQLQPLLNAVDDEYIKINVA